MGVLSVAAMDKIGITERGDAALDTSWMPWVTAGRPAILITKNPQELSKVLEKYAYEPDSTYRVGFPNIIIHCTITGFGGTILEPNVPPYLEALEAYRELVAKYGTNRVVLRIDPVIPTEKGIATARRILSALYHTRVRISFIDNYDHVKRRLRDAGVPLPWETLHAPLEARINAWAELQKIEQNRSDRTGIEICGEPDFKCTGCVSLKDCETLWVGMASQEKNKQRPVCACLMNKHELLSNRTRCAHNCLYCYWV